jgi:hypothetical protein
MSTRRSLAGLLGLLLTGIMAFGLIGSAAWFTDQDTVPVTGTTGQIDFKASGTDSAGITLTNLLPGEWSGLYQVNVYNQVPSTTTAVKYRITDAFTAQSIGGLYQLINVTVRHTFCGTPNPATWPSVYSGPVENLDVNSIDDAISDTLGLNDTHCYYYQFQLDETAGNAFQNQTVSFDLVFDATQPSNPGWTE